MVRLRCKTIEKKLLIPQAHKQHCATHIFNVQNGGPLVKALQLKATKQVSIAGNRIVL
jgi:hypothetical protein